MLKLSKPKLNQNLSSTEFEVRLHSYSDIHPTTHHPPGTHHVVVVVNWPGRVGQRHTVQLYTHTQVSASLHCISERLTFLFSKAWDFENFWLRIQKYCGYGQKGYSLGLKKKISEFGAIFFQNHSRREKSKTWTSLGTYFSVCSYSRYLIV